MTEAQLARRRDQKRAWRAANPENRRVAAARSAAYEARKKAEDPEAWRAKRRDELRRWRAENPGKARAKSRRASWVQRGIDVRAAEALFAAHDGCCAICRSNSPGGRGTWHVDHCHATGKVRELLCSSCNTALGHFNDDPALLATAAAYLRRHGQ